MINQQLLIFIKQSLSQGIDKEKITNDLLSNGWNKKDIEEGFNSLNVSNINNSETKIPETQIEKTQKNAKDSSGLGLKIVIVILILVFLLIFGFIFYKGIIEKNKIKDSSLVNEEQKQLIDQENQEFDTKQAEAPVVFGDENFSEGSNKINQSESDKNVSINLGPVNCGSNMTCFINASKNCTPSFVKETRLVDVFGMFEQKTNITMTLGGLNSSNLCIYESRIDDIVSLDYTSEMKDMIKSMIEENKDDLTEDEIKSAYDIPEDSLSQAEDTIGMTTKCTFTTTYLTELLVKWTKGSFGSKDLESGNCKITDSTGRQIPTMGTISFSTSRFK